MVRKVSATHRKQATRPAKVGKMSIGFRAHPVRDADLVEWWTALTTGERSTALRQVMRIGLAQNTPPTVTITDISADTAWIRNALTDLPSYLERLITQVATTHPNIAEAGNTAAQTQTAQVADEVLDLRRSRLGKTAW
jgi:hypothetical protein